MRAIFGPPRMKVWIRSSSPMTPEDWGAVSRIYVEALPRNTPPSRPNALPIPRGTLPTQRSAVWSFFPAGAGRVVCFAPGRPPVVLPGRGRGKHLCSEQFRGHGLGFQLLSALCAAAEKAGYWTLQSTVYRTTPPAAPCTPSAASAGGRRRRIARDCHGHWLDTYLMERRAAADEPEGFKKL